VASADSWSLLGLASAGWLRDGLLSSRRQVHSHPGVVVRYIALEKGGVNLKKPHQITAIQ